MKEALQCGQPSPSVPVPWEGGAELWDNDTSVGGELRWKRPWREVLPPLWVNLGGKTTSKPPGTAWGGAFLQKAPGAATTIFLFIFPALCIAGYRAGFVFGEIWGVLGGSR